MLKFLAFFILTSFSLHAGEMNSTIAPILTKKNIPHKNLAYAVVDLENGKLVHGYQQETPMILASVSKIISLYYSLSILGGDYRFKTMMSFDGKNLYLKGTGDPYLTTAHLTSFIHALKRKGIKKIEGKFIYDQSEFFFSERLSALGLEDQPDNPSIGALNVEFNRYRIWRPGHKHIPPLDILEIESTKKANPPGVKFQPKQKKDGLITWQASKKTKYKFTEELPSRNAGLYVASFFKYLANLQGIDLPEPEGGIVPGNANVIHTHKSLPLNELASLAIEYSNNIFAEMPMLAAVKKQTGKKLNLEESANTMKSWLEKNIKNVNWKQASLKNGSGLTLENKVSPETLAMFLHQVKDTEFDGRSYWSLLSISGQSGWGKRRLNSPYYSYRVMAKTGSLFYVNNIAGYFTAKSGKSYSFSILMTDHKNRNILNQSNSVKVDSVRQNAKQWSRNTTPAIDEIIMKLIDTL
jgi:D-alanyl-D-alanine carboxypeptidase/D-alanyl-D-alanine-endopeptidase (penicillin-binding protein 4)